MQYSRLFILSFLLFTEELKLDYVDEKTGEIPLSRFGLLSCLFKVLARNDRNDNKSKRQNDFGSLVISVNSHVASCPCLLDMYSYESECNALTIVNITMPARMDKSQTVMLY